MKVIGLDLLFGIETLHIGSTYSWKRSCTLHDILACSGYKNLIATSKMPTLKTWAWKVSEISPNQYPAPWKAVSSFFGIFLGFTRNIYLNTHQHVATTCILSSACDSETATTEVGQDSLSTKWWKELWMIGWWIHEFWIRVRHQDFHFNPF